MDDQREWYQKKRFWIPTALVASTLMFSGGDNEPEPAVNIPTIVPIKQSEPAETPKKTTTKTESAPMRQREVVPAPVKAPAPAGSQTSNEGCHPSYSGCLRADASDYDCAGGSGNGPYYTGRVRVVGPDVFGLDRDGDGVGCE